MTLLVHEQSIFSHLFNIFGAITLKPSSSSVFSSREANLNFSPLLFKTSERVLEIRAGTRWSPDVREVLVHGCLMVVGHLKENDSLPHPESGHLQCDQIGLFFIFSVTNLLTNVAKILW